ncbi:MAG: F0F1 ATP synthase subunit epsilon [Actinomycetes bacterium]
MADLLEVELVAADRKVWSGAASMVVARTTDGEIGILPGHAPVLGILGDGAVQIREEDGTTVVAAVHGGFLSVADNKIGILAEVAELASEIDIERAQRALDQAATDHDDEDEAAAAARRAEARLRAHGLAS